MALSLPVKDLALRDLVSVRLHAEDGLRSAHLT
jgi:hypothetical protein